jgi:hypothetical protein
MTVAAITLAPAAPAPSTGFRVPGSPYAPPQVVCATNLPRLSGLYCASPLIKPNTYDHLGVLRLGPDGTVTKVRAGNDILAAIEGDLDHTQRPTLSPGQSWSANGYHCARTTTAVRCRRGSHGFTIATHRARSTAFAGAVSSSLQVTVWPNGRGHAPQRTYTLTCAPAGGTLPQAAAACAKLTTLTAPFAPTPKGMACTMIYGGPQEALGAGRRTISRRARSCALQPDGRLRDRPLEPRPVPLPRGVAREPDLTIV